MVATAGLALQVFRRVCMCVYIHTFKYLTREQNKSHCRHSLISFLYTILFPLCTGGFDWPGCCGTIAVWYVMCMSVCVCVSKKMWEGESVNICAGLYLAPLVCLLLFAPSLSLFLTHSLTHLRQPHSLDHTQTRTHTHTLVQATFPPSVTAKARSKSFLSIASH